MAIDKLAGDDRLVTGRISDPSSVSGTGEIHPFIGIMRLCADAALWVRYESL
jgi:hypothetical protein